MACRHSHDSHIFKTSSALEYISNNLYSHNCLECLTSVISDRSLQSDIRDEFIKKFLRCFESSRVECVSVICSITVLEEAILKILGILRLPVMSDLLVIVEIHPGNYWVASALQNLFCLTSPNTKIKFLKYIYYQIILLFDKGLEYTYSLKLFCTLLDDLAVSNPQFTNAVMDPILVLLKVMFTSLNATTVCCLDCLLTYLPRKCLRSVKPYFQKVVGTILHKKDINVVEIGLDCLMKLCLCNRSFADICTYKELPVVLRALLNSHNELIKETTIKFIELLLHEFGKIAAKLICNSGIVELLFDDISLKKPYCNNILKCLESIGPDAELFSSNFIPHGIFQIITTLSSAQEYRSNVILRLINLINTFVIYYNGAVDLFMSPSTFKQLLLVMTSILENCETQTGILGITCITNIFKYERQTNDMPFEELRNFLKSAGCFSQSCSQNVKKALSEVNDEGKLRIEAGNEFPSFLLLTTVLSLLQHLQNYLYSWKKIQLKLPGCFPEIELTLSYIFFSVVMTTVLHSSTKHATVEVIYTVMELTAMYAYGICSDVVVAEVNKICGGTYGHFENFRNCISNVLKDKIRRSFRLLLPFVYKVCFLTNGEEFSFSLRSSKLISHDHSVSYTSKEILLTMITISSSTFSNIELSSDNTKSLTSFLRQDDLMMWITLLLHGFKYFEDN
ncbi:unnamed protein product [Heterobilharzia americana]|nr:unnamed protein product [Heterobilharzia americana]